jgi:hypothetical protein
MRVSVATCGAAHSGIDPCDGHDRSAAMTEHAVVIVGGGPTGLTLAGELALAGVGRRDGRATLRSGRHGVACRWFTLAYHRGSRSTRNR